jgi:alginate O-acetyltransferase complex protein AlgI
MLFSSLTFIYLFLPILFILYFIAKKEFRNMILLIASLIFYAYGEPKFLILMLLLVITNYCGALAIDKFRYSKFSKLVLILSILANIGSLIYFKYFNFIVDNINSLFHSSWGIKEIILPLGISFYTFQAMSYIIDVYKGECSVQKNLYKLALYICLFPQLIAGPIIKYHDVCEQIEKRNENFENICLGAKRFIIGLSKKVLIANILGATADKIFALAPDTFSPFVAWLGIICYSLQLFFDFSGYSDMAIGLGLIFGFKFMENFNYPYISKSIGEFWRRWHISLSTWFKQYVYISLGGNRSTLTRTCFNLGIVFLLTGIWHGAAWNFVLWGLWHGFFIILEKITKFEKAPNILAIRIFKHIYAIIIFIIGWVMFRANDLSHAFKYILNMFGGLKWQDISDFNAVYEFGTVEIIALVAAILCCTPIFKNILNIKNTVARIAINLWLIFLFVFSTIAITASTYNPFIYFRF